MGKLLRVLTVCALAVSLASTASAQSSSGVTNASQKKIAVLDDCDPGDPGWNPTGGCHLDAKEGDVSLAEFQLLLNSPLSTAVVGHPSWRNEPSYATVTPGTSIRVTNEGGRGHTFTKVAQFGGGVVPPLNTGLLPAPECLGPAFAATTVEPGASIDVTPAGAGIHRYQCCIHPWMRAAIKVAEKN